MTVADRIDAPTQLLGGGRVVTPDGVLQRRLGAGDAKGASRR